MSTESATVPYYHDHYDTSYSFDDIEWGNSSATPQITKNQEDETDHTRENNTGDLQRFTVGAPVHTGPAKRVQPDHLKMNSVESDIANLALKAGLPKRFYKLVVIIVKRAMIKAVRARKVVKISTRTLEGLFYKLDKNSGKSMLIFREAQIDVESIPDFPQDYVKDFRETFGTIKLVYRDIFQLAQYIFSYKEFAKYMITRPEIMTRNGERVYQDIHTAKWWEELQSKIPSGAVVLSIMLSSDQTSVSGNHRFKAWPVYMKLANVPLEIRNKSGTRASRVLAYLPVLDAPSDGKKRTSWPHAKSAIIHHCLSVILAPFANRKEYTPISMKGPGNKMYQCVLALAAYIADLPEQRLLALVKNGNTLYSCPRCWILTSDFNLPWGIPKKLRTKRLMKSLFEKGKKLVRLRDKSKKHMHAPEKLTKKYSFHVTMNAFWAVPHFDIYSSILVDELHQIGGAYIHLATCIEKMLTSKDIQAVNERVRSKIPRYRKQRHFKSGYLMSSLINPTYDELKQHMAILLVCIHDKIHQQAILCLRHFIDFAYQATAKEHSDTTIKNMQHSLTLYSKYSPIFGSISKSTMAFPKNHMLWKYAHDIQSHGVVGAYSTCQSENQHKSDAKLPAKRSNYNPNIYTSQMGIFLARRDALYDLSTEDQQVGVYNAMRTNTVSERLFRLGSPRFNGEYIPLDILKDKSVEFKQIASLIRLFLQTDVDGITSRTRISKTPQLPSNSVTVFNFLKILQKADDDNDSYTEILCATDSFRGKEWYDSVELEGGYYGKLLLFFRGQYQGQDHDLCLVQRFAPCINASHITGMEVLTPCSNERYGGRKVVSIKDIIRTVHIVPDFSTLYNPKNGYYKHYLVNHDINRDSWSENKGDLQRLQGHLVTWEDVTKEKEDTSGRK
ncbi:hypothetical protein BJV82DRAFT_675350 [Fennellomyces sp. T-0311]|nr:hypothetical protein BJV82DRAFT_675350 [Fennellomyces sp. T-0311]